MQRGKPISKAEESEKYIPDDNQERRWSDDGELPRSQHRRHRKLRELHRHRCRQKEPRLAPRGHLYITSSKRSYVTMRDQANPNHTSVYRMRRRVRGTEYIKLQQQQQLKLHNFAHHPVLHRAWSARKYQRRAEAPRNATCMESQHNELWRNLAQRQRSDA